VHHVARDLAEWSRRNVADVAATHDLDLDHDVESPSRLDGLTETVSSLPGRPSEPGLKLLEDLRDLYLMASENSLA
jgi:hypothetical protein